MPMMPEDTRLHPLETTCPPPHRFTCPFHYEPHPLCRMAAQQVQTYVQEHDEWHDELAHGKMFGVLVVETREGRRGFVAAYSGLLAGRNDHTYFVPSVFDAMQPDGYFKRHEAEITALNTAIAALSAGDDYRQACLRAQHVRREGEEELERFRQMMSEAKQRRDARRASCTPLMPDEQAKLVAESQYMKAEWRRLKARVQKRQEEASAALRAVDEQIEGMKRLRKEKSDSLQRWLFEHYVVLNALGEPRSLLSIFADTPRQVPPAGAGDCCAPKLLQYAYRQGWHPLCMAEFWWGESPRGEIRRHGAYYPACRGKCLPILTHMLQGLEVDACNVERGVSQPLSVIYEDQWLMVVNKPEGLKSVPGRNDGNSVLAQLQARLPQTPWLVHRLDMDTSGLLVVAKDKSTYTALQRQFASRLVKKRYVALLQGLFAGQPQGEVSLPLYADPLDRPYQKVDMQQGKEAVTTYQVLGVYDGHTRVALFPHTGRTHQLRVHCAHAAGLGIPILGDRLYGTRATRLYLHAEMLSFRHPVTGRQMTFECKADF